MAFKNEKASALLSDIISAQKEAKKPVKRKRVEGGSVAFNELSHEERNEMRLGAYNVIEVISQAPIGNKGEWFIQLAKVQWGEERYDESAIDIRKVKIVDGQLVQMGKGISMKQEQFSNLFSGVDIESLL